MPKTSCNAHNAMKDSKPYRPKRHLLNEIYALVLVLTAPAGVALVFPYPAIGFKPDATRGMRTEQPLCAFISLSEEEADAAVMAARSSIKTALDGVSGIRADLSISSIPEENGAAVDLAERQGFAATEDVPYGMQALPRSHAAPPPRRIRRASAPHAAPPPAFDREEMLAIDDE